MGHELRVTETASNAGGSGTAAESAATAVVVPPVPVDSTVPTVTGTAQQGQTLTEHHGEWSNSPTGYVYQWLRCNSSGLFVWGDRLVPPTRPTRRWPKTSGTSCV